MSWVRLLLGLPAILLGFLLLGSSPAAAHSELESTTPAADTTVTEPVTSVSLTFSDEVQPGFAQIAVLDPAGGDIADGAPTIEGNTVIQSVTEATAGTHSVSYRIVSADGHTVQGTYAFTVAVPDPQPAAPSSTAASPSPTTASPSEAAASPAAQANGEEGSTGQTVAIVVVLALGVIASAAITLARRRHRRG